MNTEETEILNECPNYDKCHDEGYDYGYDRGFTDGHDEGYDLGIEHGKQKGDEDSLDVDLSTVREMLVMLHKESLDVEPLILNGTHVCNTTLHKCPFLVTVNYKDTNRFFCAYINNSLEYCYYSYIVPSSNCPLKELL